MNERNPYESDDTVDIPDFSSIKVNDDDIDRSVFKMNDDIPSYNEPEYDDEEDYKWGLGYGYSYMSKTPYGNNTIRTDASGPINNATIRHIVGVPNHFRCWERHFYFGIGGHNKFMRIADDYELIVRSFLYTRFTHIPVCCYAQRFDGNNSQYKNEYEESDGCRRFLCLYGLRI